MLGSGTGILKSLYLIKGGEVKVDCKKCPFEKCCDKDGCPLLHLIIVTGHGKEENNVGT